MRFPRKSFVFGFLTGATLLLLLEGGLIVLAKHYLRKTPQEIAEHLTAPPIPSTIEADLNLPLKSLEGEAFDFSGLRGKVIFLTFWDPDCSSCQAELPSVERLYEKTAEDGIAFVLAAKSGTEMEAAHVSEEFELTAPVYVLEGERPDVYDKEATPASFIITPDGKIAFKHEGPALWDDDAAVNFLRSLNLPEAGGEPPSTDTTPPSQ